MLNRFYLGNLPTYPDLGSYLVPDGITKKIMVDMGSCGGEFLLKYADQFEECFAFEASYENFINIVESLKKNHLDNCAVFNLAAADVSGPFMKLNKAPSGERGSSSFILPAQLAPESSAASTMQGGPVAVPSGMVSYADTLHPFQRCHSMQRQQHVMTISFEDIFKFLNVDYINYLKVDIEGAEYAFLLGKDLSRVDVIGIEIHAKRGYIEQVNKLMAHIRKTHVFTKPWYNGEIPNPSHHIEDTAIRKDLVKIIWF